MSEQRRVGVPVRPNVGAAAPALGADDMGRGRT